MAISGAHYMTKPKDAEPDDLAAEPDELDAAEVELDQAEQELRESLSLVSAIEERVATGDESVTSEDLSSRHSLGRFAQLRTQALRAKVERLRGDAHRKMCAQVADQVQQLADESGPGLAAALRAAQDAVRTFVALVEARNGRLSDLYEEARQLVPEFTGPGSEVRGPSAAHARLGWQAKAVVLGRRKLLPLDPAPWLGAGLAEVARDLDGGLNLVPRHDRKDPVEELAKVDDERPVQPGFKYFRSTSGNVIGFNRPLGANEARGLTALTDTEVEQYLTGGAA
jgi:hypothetical protein